MGVAIRACKAPLRCTCTVEAIKSGRAQAEVCHCPFCGLHLKKWSVVKHNGTAYTVLRLQGSEDGGKVLAVALFEKSTKFLKVPQLKCAKCFDKNDYLNKYLKDSGYSRVDFNKCDAEPYVSQDSPDKPAWTKEEILAIKSPKKGTWKKAQSRLQKLGMISWNRPGCSVCKNPMKTGTIVYHKKIVGEEYKIVKSGKKKYRKGRLYAVSTGRNNKVRSFSVAQLMCKSCHNKKRRRLMDRMVCLEQAMF